MTRDLRLTAKRIQRSNPKNNTKECVNCLCMKTVYGRIWCEVVGDYKTRDYECPREKTPFTYKLCMLYLYVRNKGVVNIEWYLDGEETGKIRGFGYVDIITISNIDTYLEEKDKYYEKWYCRWIDAFCDELVDNRKDNSGGY